MELIPCSEAQALFVANDGLTQYADSLYTLLWLLYKQVCSQVRYAPSWLYSALPGTARSLAARDSRSECEDEAAHTECSDLGTTGCTPTRPVTQHQAVWATLNGALGLASLSSVQYAMLQDAMSSKDSGMLVALDCLDAMCLCCTNALELDHKPWQQETHLYL